MSHQVCLSRGWARALLMLPDQVLYLSCLHGTHKTTAAIQLALQKHHSTSQHLSTCCCAYRWQTIQQLHHHTTPVLSLCTLPCPSLIPSPPSVTPSSPSTVGSGPPEHADRDLPQSPAPAHQQDDGCSGDRQQQQSLLAQLVFSGATNGSIAAWRVVDNHSRVCLQQQQQQGCLVWSEERWHQSGVNAMHAAVTPGMTAASAAIYTTWFHSLCLPRLCLH